MNAEPAAKWDAHYRALPEIEPAPAEILSQHAHLLPASGSALDLACGAGGNALFLARRGFSVTARDLSSVAIGRLGDRAEKEGLRIAAETVDVEKLPWPPEHYDVIVVSRYLHRPLAPAIAATLSPGGLLFYQTYTRDKSGPCGPSNPAYLLDDNELLVLFQGLRVRFYREDARCGELSAGRRDQAYLIGQRPFSAS